MMLDRTVLRAKKLGLREDQLAALLEVRRMLASGELLHATIFYGDQAVAPYPGAKRAFNMAGFFFDLIDPETKYICGECHCIGGWIEVLTDLKYLFDRKKMRAGLDALFYPDNMWDMTPADAVHAIDTFLATGWPEWPEKH